MPCSLVIPKCLQFHKHTAFSHDLLALQTQGLFLKSPYFISSVKIYIIIIIIMLTIIMETVCWMLPVPIILLVFLCISSLFSKHHGKANIQPSISPLVIIILRYHLLWKIFLDALDSAAFPPSWLFPHHYTIVMALLTMY